MSSGLRKFLLVILLLPSLALLAVVPLSQHYITPLLLKLLKEGGVERPTLERVSIGLGGLNVGKAELHWNAAQAGSSLRCDLDDFRVSVSWMSVMRAKSNTAYADKIDAKHIECNWKRAGPVSPILIKGPVAIVINPDGMTGNFSATGDVAFTDIDKLPVIPFASNFTFDLSGGYSDLKTAGEIRIKNVIYGFQVSDIRLQIGIEPNEPASSVQVIRSSGGLLSILGGVVKLKPFKFRSDARNKVFELKFEGVNLESLLDKYPAGHVVGTGLLDGELKVLANKDNSISADGEMRARLPGGIIKGDLSEWTAAYPENKNIATAALAVQNFQYSSLQAKIEYQESGDLRVALEMKGVNPELNNSQPINLNVNIDENLPALLQTMRLMGKG